MTVYVYTEYCDTQPYETELIEVYQSERDAKTRLVSRVQEHYQKTWEEIQKEISDYDEEMSETCVKLWEGDDRCYWMVQPLELITTESIYTK